METYAQLFSSILDSSVWRESSDTRVVWVTMMAMADADGCVWASMGGIADRARLPRDVVQSALDIFMSPDPDSRSPNDDGRRVEKIDRGWRLINYVAHKERSRLAADRERKRRWAAKQRAKNSTNSSTPRLQVDAVKESRVKDPKGSDLLEVRAKDLTGSAKQDERSAVATADVACPVDLKLNKDQRDILEMLGMEPWQIDAMQGAFVLRSISEGTEPRPLSAWLKCMAKAITSDWNNGYRPKKPTEQPKSTDNGGIPYV